MTTTIQAPGPIPPDASPLAAPRVPTNVGPSVPAPAGRHAGDAFVAGPLGLVPVSILYTESAALPFTVEHNGKLLGAGLYDSDALEDAAFNLANPE